MLRKSFIEIRKSIQPLTLIVGLTDHRTHEGYPVPTLAISQVQSHFSDRSLCDIPYKETILAKHETSSILQ